MDRTEKIDCRENGEVILTHRGHYKISTERGINS